MLFIASDHAGFQLKNRLRDKLKGQGISVEDLGTDSEESCDYPDFAKKLADKVLENSSHAGVLICGTGVGMSVAANKIKGIRAACVSETKSAEMSRKHNNAQVLCMGARIISFEQALKCVDMFLRTKFESEHPRHQNRIDKISSLEVN